jgi:hypothetical protein
MTFAVEWDFPARSAFNRIPWPRSADVAALVYRFAATRAPHLESGAYPLRGAGYRVAVRVDHRAGTVLVLYLEPLRPR